MIIEIDGKECKCGKKGCFERYSSMKNFKNELRKNLNLEDATRGQDLLDMIRKNKPENKNYEIIENTVNEYIKYLSIRNIKFDKYF